MNLLSFKILLFINFLMGVILVVVEPYIERSIKIERHTNIVLSI